MKWFQEDDLKDVNTLRTAYKKLLLKFHPDNNAEDTTARCRKSMQSMIKCSKD